MNTIDIPNAIFAALFALMLLAGLGFIIAKQTDAALDYNLINRGVSASSTVATTGSTIVLATSTASRTYARITNDSGTNKIYLSFGNAAAQGKGIALAPNTSFVLDDTNMFYGAIYAVASTSAVNVSTFEGFAR